MTVEQIGQIIRAERKRQGLRQDELAAASGVGIRFLLEVEAGKQTAQIGKVLAVLKALGCDVSLSMPGQQ